MAFEDQRTTVYKVDPEHPESESLPTLRTEELLLNMGPVSYTHLTLPTSDLV